MIFGFLRKNNVSREAAYRQYAVLTAAARQTPFFEHAGVPDTVIGRFEMISVIVILYLRRMTSAGPTGKAVAQEIVDAFFQDLDHSVRELGIGDHGVPKRMKKLASMFYGRLDSYGKALDSGDAAALSAALKRNFHPETDDEALSMSRLANYMVRAEQALAGIADDVLERGEAPILEMEDEPIR